MKTVIFDFNRTLYDPDREQLMEGAIELLEHLKEKVGLALIAKGDDKRREQIKQLNLQQYFPVIIIDENKNVGYFRKCMEYFDARPEETFVIGDRVKKEIRFGNEIGATTIWFRDGKYKDELPDNGVETPKHTIKNLKEAIKLLGI